MPQGQAPAMPPASIIDLGTVKLAVRQWGSGSPLMLVHGLGTCSELWREQVAFNAMLLDFLR